MRGITAHGGLRVTTQVLMVDLARVVQWSTDVM